MNDAGTVVLGVGSPLMGDDGLGVDVVERLRTGWEGDSGLALLDGGTWGMRVLPFIETAQRLLIVDAIKNGGAPGDVVRLDGDEIPRHLRQKLSPHQIELGEVLAVAELRGNFPSEAIAMGIEPARIELMDGLSPTVEQSVPTLIEAIEAQLRTWGHRPTGRSDESADVNPPAPARAGVSLDAAREASPDA
jgi:hydrogenase maturation protease